MIKTITIIECDICHDTENAKPVAGRYDEPEYTAPTGWQWNTCTGFCICPRCLRKLGR